MKYKCSACGKEHDEWPSLAYSSPANYNDLTEEEQKTIAGLGSDFCVIEYDDQIDRFVRCTLTQKVNDHCQDLEYGIWVSLSEKSYNDYYDNFESENHVTDYFGWFCSRIPDYENMLEIPTTVKTRAGNSRPEVIPHKDFDHPFVRDYYQGISKQEAEERIARMMNRTSNS